MINDFVNAHVWYAGKNTVASLQHQALRQRRRVDDLTLGCVNAQSVANKSATLCRAIADDHLDVLVVTETWHEDSESTPLKRTVPPGYRCVSTLPDRFQRTSPLILFQNHGGPAFIYRDSDKFQKKLFDINSSSFEYMCGLTTIRSRHVLHAARRLRA